MTRITNSPGRTLRNNGGRSRSGTYWLVQSTGEPVPLAIFSEARAALPVFSSRAEAHDFTGAHGLRGFRIQLVSEGPAGEALALLPPESVVLLDPPPELSVSESAQLVGIGLDEFRCSAFGDCSDGGPRRSRGLGTART